MVCLAIPDTLLFAVGLFAGNTGFDEDISGWDTSAVVYMDNMFDKASSFTGTGIGNWDVSNVIWFTSM